MISIQSEHFYRSKNKIDIVCDVILTVCPRSSDPFYIGTYNIKWVNIFGNFIKDREKNVTIMVQHLRYPKFF